MKKYRQSKRGIYKAHTRKLYTHDTCGGRDIHKLIGKRIHITPTYDGYRHIEYMSDVYKKERNNRTRTHIGMTNVMRETFPEIDTPHTQKTYRGTAPARKYAPRQGTYKEPPKYTQHVSNTHKDRRTVKCIIYNRNDEIIYIGTMNRTRIVDMDRHTIHITLHRNKRTMDARECVPPTKKIHGVDIQDIRKHGVEIYRI